MAPMRLGSGRESKSMSQTDVYNGRPNTIIRFPNPKAGTHGYSPFPKPGHWDYALPKTGGHSYCTALRDEKVATEAHVMDYHKQSKIHVILARMPTSLFPSSSVIIWGLTEECLQQSLYSRLIDIRGRRRQGYYSIN